MKLLKPSTTLALALAAGHASAVTVTLDPHGLGQSLLFPYFTASNGQTTLVTVQNTTPQGKALKVLAYESYAGQPTLSFNLYLPPFARWSGALTQADPATDAPAVLLPSPSSVGCSLPAIGPQGVELRPFAYAGDGGPQGDARTREGYLAVVEMGTLDAELTALVRDSTEANCATFAQRASVNGGIWSTAPNTGIDAPNGRLRGGATVLDVAGGTAFSYAAPAFAGVATTARHTTLDVSGTVPYIAMQPDLTSVQATDNEEIEVTVQDKAGNPVTLQYGSDEGYYAISALLATTNTTNDFNILPDLRARTEWIVSFPTRQALHGAFLWGTPPANTLLAAPFSGANVPCETTALVAWDEHGVKLETDASVDVCGAVQVLQFGHDGALPSPQLALDGDPVVDMPVAVGTARLDFSKVDDRTRAFFGDRNGKCVVGLPAWVMSVQSYDNDNAQAGRIATYPVSNVSSGPADVVDCASLQN